MSAEKPDSNECDTGLSVYKDRRHVKDIDGSIGSLTEFCGAFYHVPQSPTLRRVCLDKSKCSIAIGPKAKELSQPKTAVALVKFLLEDGTHFLKRYTSCRSNKTHAEEYFVNDVQTNNCSFIGLEKVTMYITMQPCHKSTRPGTQGTKDDWSCCDILIDLAKNELKDVKIVIKPTHLLKADWDKTNKSEQDRELIDNAKEGIKNLMRTDNITLSKMESVDWEFLFKLVEGQVQEEQERNSLDDEIGNFLTTCQNEVEAEKEQKDIEPLRKRMDQTKLSKSKNKKK